jgi:hypothetical protein
MGKRSKNEKIRRIRKALWGIRLRTGTRAGWIMAEERFWMGLGGGMVAGFFVAVIVAFANS